MTDLYITADNVKEVGTFEFNFNLRNRAFHATEYELFVLAPAASTPTRVSLRYGWAAKLVTHEGHTFVFLDTLTRGVNQSRQDARGARDRLHATLKEGVAFVITKHFQMGGVVYVLDYGNFPWPPTAPSVETEAVDAQTGVEDFDLAALDRLVKEGEIARHGAVYYYPRAGIKARGKAALIEAVKAYLSIPF